MPPRKNPVESHASLFRRTDQGVPELQVSADIPPASQPSVEPLHQPNGSMSVDIDVPQRLKRTFYLEPDVTLLLSEVQIDEMRRTGHKPELSKLVSQAIRMLGSERQITKLT